MPEQSDLDRRLRAVERAVTEGDQDVATLQDTATIVDRMDAIEERIETLEERTAELDAATQAVRGYVGNVRAVNEEVEDRADAALAAVDRIEARLEDRQRNVAPTDSTEAARGEGTRAEATRGDRQRERRRDELSTSTSDGEPADDEFGIEMPPPGAADGNRGGGEDEEQSVIDRVREAL